jgi:phosphate transport system permease protein
MNQQEQHQFNTRRFRKDWIASKVVTLFGWLVLATFLLLIWHVFSNAFPLFKSPILSIEQSSPVPPKTKIVGIAELGSGISYVGRNQCDLVILNNVIEASPTATLTSEQSQSLATSQILPSLNRMLQEVKRFPFSCEHRIVFPEHGNFNYIGIVTPSNLFELYHLSYAKDQYQLTLESSIALDLNNSLKSLLSQDNLKWTLTKSGNFVMLTRLQDGMLHSYWFDKKTPASFKYLAFDNIGLYQAIPRSRQLLLVSDNILSLVGPDGKITDRLLLKKIPRKVFLSPSQRSLFTQDSQQTLSKWIMLNEKGQFVFRQNEFDKIELDYNIDTILFDGSSNAALIFSKSGEITFLNRISNEIFSPQDFDMSAIGTKWLGSNLYVFSENISHRLSIKNLQGITTLKSLFSEVWYEGYEKPEYVWQTSSASDNYETKFSIMPLIIGSLKASFLALFVAIPLALGAAIYTSYFAEQSVRQYLKPSIEMLEAVPSVVIGFIAAIWLVPIAEEFLLSVILFIILLPVLLVTSAILYSKVANLWSDKFDKRWEIVIILLSVILLGVFCFLLSDVWRLLLAAGQEAIGQGIISQNDAILNISKTTIVVAIALGVAISPSIYSLAEDALFEVPESVKQASFALGATKLQTLRRVIIAIAMPSILSAVMLGFGRAFGETMIVLMVTGNTPVADWNILEGLRSMTANLAIELQESNVDSSHFNTLFLTAGILFIFTFIVNTAAEILRNRLRKVYTNA